MSRTFTKLIAYRLMAASLCFGILTALMIHYTLTEPEPRKPRTFTVRLEKP